MAGKSSCEAAADGCRVTDGRADCGNQGKLFSLFPCDCSLIYTLLATPPSMQFFCEDVGDWTQSLGRARPELYHSVTPLSSFYFVTMSLDIAEAGLELTPHSELGIPLGCYLTSQTQFPHLLYGNNETSLIGLPWQSNNKIL